MTNKVSFINLTTRKFNLIGRDKGHGSVKWSTEVQTWKDKIIKQGNVTNHGKLEILVEEQGIRASRTTGYLIDAIWRSKNISKEVKKRIYKTIANNDICCEKTTGIHRNENPQRN